MKDDKDRKEYIREKNREYRLRNKEKIKEYNKQYYLKNKTTLKIKAIRNSDKGI